MSNLEEGMNLGAQLLWRWRYDKGITQYEASKWAETHPVQWSRWENGHVQPNRKWAVILERITLGQVTCGSWDDDPLPEHILDPVINPGFDANAIWKARETKRKKAQRRK